MRPAARILAVVLVATPVSALACRFGWPCQAWIAPRDGSTIPANTPVFVAGSLPVDGGLLALKREDQVIWYAPSELATGARLTLEGTDCTGANALSRVVVGEARPFPSTVGTVRLDEVARDQLLHPCDDSGAATVSYRVTLEPGPDVVSWLPVSRFRFATAQPVGLTSGPGRFGEVTMQQGATSVRLQDVALRCSDEAVTLFTILEVAGRDPISSQTTFETPCRPRGCSTSGGLGLLGVPLLLWPRRRRR
jgi:hypothetical protein